MSLEQEDDDDQNWVNHLTQNISSMTTERKRKSGRCLVELYVPWHSCIKSQIKVDKKCYRTFHKIKAAIPSRWSGNVCCYFVALSILARVQYTSSSGSQLQQMNPPPPKTEMGGWLFRRGAR